MYGRWSEHLLWPFLCFLGGYTTIEGIYKNENNGLKYLILRCKVDLKKIKSRVTWVDQFYFFYQPLEELPNARVMLAGLVNNKGVWVNPYRLRMFPQLLLLLDKNKGMSWWGVEGSGKQRVSREMNHIILSFITASHN